ncbi:MAG: hypothetical protein Q8N15_05745 [Bacillota bacterium]|nr:hypothetical protein [Bacillota bacterium]
MKKQTRWIWLLVGLAVLAVAVRFAFYFLSDEISGGNWQGYMPMGGAWAMPLGMLGMGAFWIFVVFLVFRAFSVRGCGMQHDHATARLKERLANGDITIEEYETLRKTLEEDR